VLHLGTDAAGSIRIPCAMSGLAGLKPTFGRIAVYPPSPFGTLSHIGPMTRRITDAAHMLRAMAGRDLTDWAQGSGDLGALDAVELTFKGARIGLWATPPCGAVDADVAANLARSAALIEALGADVEPIALPFADTITRDFEAHWFSGAAARLRLVPDEKRGLVDPGFRDIAARGAAIGADELVAAQMARGAFGAAMDQLLDRYDVLIAPGTAIPAFAAGRLVPEGSGLTDWHQWAGFTFPINLSTQPAAVVPNGRTRDGLPTSLQFIGARGADARVLAVARAYEIAMPEYLI